jgi:diguanylate cyclase (GGDEF)-like protein
MHGRRTHRDPGAGLPARTGSRLVHLGVSGRLLGTIAVPLVLVALLLGNVTVQRYGSVDLAQRVATATRKLERLTELRSNLFAERLAEELFVPSRRPPKDLLRTTSFGAEFLHDPWAMQRRTDAALAALAPRDRPFTHAQLERVRQNPLALGVGDGNDHSRLDSLDLRIVESLDDQVNFVRDTATRLGGADLVAAATTLQRSVALPEQAGDLVAALVDLWVAEPPARAGEQSEVAAASSRLDLLSTRFQASIGRDAGLVGSTWSRSAHPPTTLRAAIRDALAGTLSDPTRDSGQPVSVGLGLIDGIDWLIAIDQVPSAAAESVQGAARHLADSLTANARATILLALGSVGVSIAMAVLFGRSIATPVRRLSEQALRVGGGDLDVEPLRLRGPLEITRASHAFNDMVDNLVLLERKARALADCDFTDPALHQPLPGLLGASLQRSVEVLSDSVEERQQLQLRLGFEATHDPLTGLGNRAELIDSLRRMQRAAGANGVVAVIFIDLDDFKPINDRHGHAAGDELLRAVAGRMQSRIPADAMLARLGGDEFVCAIGGVTEPGEAVEIARRLVDAVAEPVSVDGRWLQVGASAGVALAQLGDDDERPLELLRKADVAVYTAKAAGTSGHVAVYDDALDRRLAREDDVVHGLRRALRPGSTELRMTYQPVVDATSGQLHALEALVRWSRPSEGPIGPDEFIPLAERSGLIVDLDRWILGHVFGQAARWFADPAFDGVQVSANVSGRTLLDPAFVEFVTTTLAHTGADPTRIVLEVTETAIVTDLELAAAQLSAIRRLGVRVAIDDFGTGYTSIAHLRALPVDAIKIDSSFVHRLLEEDNVVFVQAINDLAHKLRIPTVAEGVETVEQLQILRSVACDRVQGYLFSPPIECEAVPGRVRSFDARSLFRAAVASAVTS